MNKYKNIITKSNALIYSCYSFSLLEMQILLHAISLINPFSDDCDLVYEIDIKDFAKQFSKKNKNIHSEVNKTISNKFWNQEIKYYDKKNKCYVAIRWLDEIRYYDKSAKFRVCFSYKARPFLCQLKRSFTSYNINMISKFRSIFSIRVYEFCVLEVNIKATNLSEFLIPLDILKERLELENKYALYKNFKSRVLQKARTEINAHSDLTIDFEEIKKGRKVESIKFIVERKEGEEPANYANPKLNHDKKSIGGDDENPVMASKQPQGALPQSQQNKNEAIVCDNATNLSNSDAGCKRGYAEHQTLVAQMCKYGLKQKRALDLIEDYGAHFCEQGAAKMKKAIKDGYNINNSAAYLTTCITSSVELVKGSEEIKAEEQQEFIDEQLSCAALENILRNNLFKKTEKLEA